jgi:hypothetical protein
MQTTHYDLFRIDTQTGAREHYARLADEESALRAVIFAERYDEQAYSEFVVEATKPVSETVMTRLSIRKDQRKCLWQKHRGRSWAEAVSFATTGHWTRTAWRD